MDVSEGNETRRESGTDEVKAGLVIVELVEEAATGREQQSG